MPAKLDCEGVFRGEIISYGLSEMESGAMAINVTARINDAWDERNEDWLDWCDDGIETEGAIWVVKKDGTINQMQVEALMQYAGWDGDLRAIIEERWAPTPCQFRVTEDSYQGKTRFRIAWLDAYDAVPRSGLSNVDAERAKELQAKYGGQFRALAGNVKRSKAAPKGKPAAPKKRAEKPPFPDPNAQPQHGEDPAGEEGEGDTPF